MLREISDYSPGRLFKTSPCTLSVYLNQRLLNIWALVFKKLTIFVFSLTALCCRQQDNTKISLTSSVLKKSQEKQVHIDCE